MWPKTFKYVEKYKKSLNSKQSQKLPHDAKQFATDALKTTSERALQRTAEATGDLTVNKIAIKITNV